MMKVGCNKGSIRVYKDCILTLRGLLFREGPVNCTNKFIFFWMKRF